MPNPFSWVNLSQIVPKKWPKRSHSKPIFIPDVPELCWWDLHLSGPRGGPERALWVSAPPFSANPISAVTTAAASGGTLVTPWRPRAITWHEMLIFMANGRCIYIYIIVHLFYVSTLFFYYSYIILYRIQFYSFLFVLYYIISYHSMSYRNVCMYVCKIR